MLTIRKNAIKKTIVLGGLLITEFLLFLSAYFTEGSSISNLLHALPDDRFMDFFNVLRVGADPYSQGLLYPPLTHLLMSFFTKMVPSDLLEQTTGFALRDSQIGMMIFFLFSLVEIFFFSVITVHFIKSENSLKSTSWESELITILLLLSHPFIFCFERGNIIILSLTFLIIFVHYYDSQSRTLRWIAFIALAISAATKIYPAIYGLLLIREKKWKQSIEVMVLGVIVFFVPFLFLEPNSRDPFLFWDNIFTFKTQMDNIGTGYRHDLGNIFHILSIVTGKDLALVGSAFLVICVILTVLVLLFSPNLEKWKVYALLSLSTILYPGMNFTYSIIFMVIPLIAFLSEEGRDNKLMVFLYSLLFLLCFAPLVCLSHEDLLGNPSPAQTPLTWPSIIESAGLILMLAFILLQGCYQLLHCLKLKHSPS